MKRAFTLLELVVVIVITGILALVGIEITINIYRSYLQSRAINTLEAETELVLEQIAKRLAIRIKGSSIGRQPAPNHNTFVSTEDPGLNSAFTILEWTSYSYETFQNGGWSGFIDLNHANTNRIDPANPANTINTIETPLSALQTAWLNIRDLTNNPTTATTQNQLGVFFKGTGNINVQTSFGYNAANQADAIARVRSFNGNTTINIDYPVGSRISEQYYLLHTAYAVVPTNTTAENDFTLELRYNYRPWTGNSFQTANSAVLARNVTRFNFTEANGVVVLKLCIRDAQRSLANAEQETTVCKTKAVY